MYGTKETTKTLNNTAVKPHLEYASVWNSYRKKNEKVLESFQRRAAKQASELRNSDYSAQLGAFRLTTLKARRERGDVIQ